MGRPHKYKTPKLAAEAFVLHSVIKLYKWERAGHYLNLTRQRCHLCGVMPMESKTVDRVDGSYTIRYNRIHSGETTCKMCIALTKIATIQEVRSYAARILAKRKHELDKVWVNPGPDKLQAARGGHE